VWTALEKELRLSAVYEVSFVDIVAKTRCDRLVRVSRKHDLTVTVADNDRRSPASSRTQGSPEYSSLSRGTTSRAGTATVRIGGQLVLNRVAITTTNRIEATVPVLRARCLRTRCGRVGPGALQGFFEVKP
jgi:hypothetical protein